MCKNVDEHKETRKNNNYDTISHKTVAAETMTFKPADNVSSIWCKPNVLKAIGFVG